MRRRSKIPILGLQVDPASLVEFAAELSKLFYKGFQPPWKGLKVYEKDVMLRLDKRLHPRLEVEHYGSRQYAVTGGHQHVVLIDVTIRFRVSGEIVALLRNSLWRFFQDELAEVLEQNKLKLCRDTRSLPIIKKIGQEDRTTWR